MSDCEENWNLENWNFHLFKHGDNHKKKVNNYVVKFLDLTRSDILRISGREGKSLKCVEQKFEVNLKVEKEKNRIKITSHNDENIDKALQHLKNKISKTQKRDKHCKTLSSEIEASVPESLQEATIDLDTVAAELINQHKVRLKFTKNVYQENPEVGNLSNFKADQIRLKNNNTTVSCVFKNVSRYNKIVDIPNPIWKFRHCFSSYPDLLKEIRKNGLKSPTPIQAQAWPILLQGKDLIGISQTGTGKTLAFLLPAMIHIEHQNILNAGRCNGGPNVLIIAPTREIVLHIEKEINKYTFRGIRTICIHGGGNRRQQIQEINKGAEIIICTPGRLLNLINAEVIDINAITYLVLAEAYHFFAVEFEQQLEKILSDIRRDRQTVITSATWSTGIRKLAQNYMNNPIKVNIGKLDLTAIQTITQIIEIMKDKRKYEKLKNFINNMRPDDKVIIFCARKSHADELANNLTLEAISYQCIHDTRSETKGKILIATSLASRGLQIEDITHVINYDFPYNIEEYVHRMSRIGHNGCNGFSISYFTHNDREMAQPLINILNETGQFVSSRLLKMAEHFKAMERTED